MDGKHPLKKHFKAQQIACEIIVYFVILKIAIPRGGRVISAELDLKSQGFLLIFIFFELVTPLPPYIFESLFSTSTKFPELGIPNRCFSLTTGVKLQAMTHFGKRGVVLVCHF